MLLSKRWKKTKDPAAKVISALMTKVASLEGKLASSSSKNQANVTFSSLKNAKLHIPEWRTVKNGDKVDKEEGEERTTMPVFSIPESHRQ